MTNEELISKIKAEIERLKGYYRITNPYDKRAIRVCENLLSFLDSLESEKPMDQEGLDEEIINYFGRMPDDEDKITLARHFAQWGSERQKEQDDRLVDIIYQQGIEKGKDEIRKTLKRKEKK